MIARHLKRQGKSSFGRLAIYIRAAPEEGEKLDKFWMANCHSGTALENLNHAIKEVEITQSLNTRSKVDKTYHLLISFRDEDKRPDADALKEIELTYAKALGFEDHQRICATHQNTNNYHIHVAINKVHPKTLKVKTPSWDYRKLERASRAIEKKYGLAIDNGRAEKLDQDRQNTKARDYEAHTWQKSFDSFVKEQKGQIAKDLDASKNWVDFHKATSRFGIVFKKRGAGLVIANINGKEAIKASRLGREFSKAALEARLGPYKRPMTQALVNDRKMNKPTRGAIKYKPRPLLKHPNVPRLWKRYIGLKKRDQSLVGQAFYTWKQFLIYDALDDPLAMALIYFHQRVINDLSPQKKEPHRTKHKSRNLGL